MNLSVFKSFFRSGSIGGIILICCVVISLFIANSPWGQPFANLLYSELGTDAGGLRFPVLIWINDGLMAIFFLLIGLEIKRELIEGELSSFKKASLPVFAAFGGAIIPAVIFILLNAGEPTAGGWGIPMATDIAFALGVLALLGKKVPPSLKIFLAALAIADDLIAIVVIAIFYSTSLQFSNLFYACSIFLLLMVFNRMKIQSLWFYILPGLFIWYFIHHSGIHATIAGVITAFTLPTTPGSKESPLEKLEHILQKPVNFLIMPLFALANTNIHLGSAPIHYVKGPLGTGIIIGLIAGKTIGISLLSWITVKLKWSVLPAGANWKHIAGLGLLGGIGFTMSIFIAILSFADLEIQNASKVAVLIASSASGIAGFILLMIVGRNKRIIVSSQESG